MDLQDETLKFDIPVLPKSNSRSPRKFTHQHFLRKALELFLSVSLLALLLSYFTGLSFLHSFTYYFSTFFSPLITHTFERKYMFILCNTILVFLAGKSGPSSTFSLSLPSQFAEVQSEITTVNADNGILLQPENPIYENVSETCIETVGSPCTVPSDMELEQNAVLQTETLVAYKIEMKEEKGHHPNMEAEKVAKAADSAEQHQAREVEEDEEESGSIAIEGDEEESGSIVGEGYGDNDIESEGPASNTEELNKKIEEFIRKMKEELRLEAQQQQLIAA